MTGEPGPEPAASNTPNTQPTTSTAATESALIEELRALARSRSAVQFDGSPATNIDAIARHGGLPATTGRQQVIDDAIEHIGYSQYQESARALLGAGPGRWQPLSQRGEIAAAQFGISYDGFRRARTASPSLLDETLSLLARAILEGPSAGAADLGGATPASEDGWSGEPPFAADAPTDHDTSVASQTDPTEPETAPAAGRLSEDGAHPARARVGTLIVVGVVLLIAIALIAAVASRSDSKDDAAEGAAPPNATPVSSPPPSEGAVACPPSSPDISAQPELAPYVDVFTARTDEIVADPANGCPHGGLQTWDAFVVLHFATDEGETGVLAATDPSEAVWFTAAQWGSYHQVGGKSGDNAQALMGIAETPEDHGGYIVIPTDTDAVLVGETPDSPHFFLLGPARAVWEERGGAQGALGLPTSNPVVIGGALTQDFEGGYLEQLPDASVVVTMVADPAADLPPLAELEGKIVRHPDATSWYIATDGSRYWIPDGATWDCLGGASVQAEHEIRGYAISTLPYGGPATC